MLDPEHTDTPQPPPAPYAAGSDAPAYYRLNFNQLGILLKMHAEGAKQATIASALGCSQANVSLTLKRLGTDTTDLARHHFKAKAYSTSRRLSRVVEKGKDADAIKAAKLVLEGSGVISTTSTVQLGVQVLIGGEAQPAIDARSITVEVLETTAVPGVQP